MAATPKCKVDEGQTNDPHKFARSVLIPGPRFLSALWSLGGVAAEDVAEPTHGFDDLVLLFIG